MATASSMLALPPELLLRISAYLTTPELGHMRRMCKAIETALFNSFAKEFFTKRQFTIEHPSLHVLVGIANHPTLSKWLKEVIISVDALQHSSYDHDMAIPPITSYDEAGFAFRETFIHTGQARDMLVEAFSKLPNLRTVGLRDYDGRGRDRDGEDACWRSAGWSFAQSEQQHRETHALCSRLAAEPLFPLIIYSLGLACSRPTNVEVFLRRRAKLEATSFSVLHGYMAKATRPVLASLKTLMLTIGSGSTTGGDPREARDGVIQLPLKRFLQNTPALETLRLNFAPDEDFAHAFLQWLGQPSTPAPGSTMTVAADVSSLSLSKLRNLDLGMLNTDVNTLVQVLTKFDLESANLWKVALPCRNVEEFKEEDNSWRDFFDVLADALPPSTRLRNFSVGYAQFSHTELDFGRPLHAMRAYFAQPSHPTDKSMARAQDKASFRAGYGFNVKSWLSELAARTWTPDLILVTDDSEDDSEDDEDAADADGGGDDLEESESGA
ncbi:hypothetical protein LTR53_006236 [Teratosphaeriaceae sp. CCFEE 6253]|nr:hypothetical protein LTR53_006236 [Teratosphaeriaceae sp. CCFEE 6253]